MKKQLAIIFVAVFLASLIPINIASASPIEGPITGLKKLDLKTPSSLLTDDEFAGVDGTPLLEGAVPVGAQWYPNPASPWSVNVLDDYYGGYYLLDFEQVVSGVHCNIWIGLATNEWWDPDHTVMYKDEWVTNGPEVADDEFYFAYPWSYLGYGRMLAGYRDYITGAQLLEIADEFDNNIWQTDTSFFGMYQDRPGPLNDYKIQILVFNIRDLLFYDIYHAGGFIEGYFWDVASNANNANIIHIDTYQWWRRQGPTPPGVAPNVNPPYPASLLRPYEYEGTFAHEFQHLIHRDIDADELSWVNEGCSTLAENICGYGVTSNLAYYITDFWELSLVDWEGQLGNYGVVFLWTLYMYEHYGGQPFIWDIVHEQANGIQGYNNVLKKHHICKNFDQIFQDWEIANYLDDTSFAHGIYGYYGLDLPCAQSQWYDIPTVVDILGLYSPWPTYPDGPYTLPERLPYVAWYWRFDDGAPALKVKFNGDDNAGWAAHSPTNEWYSSTTNYAWYRLGHTFSIPGTGATLKFWSYYDTEPNWDYAYVEVHDVDTGEWYTLPGIQTVTTLPNNYGTDNPYCPDEFEPTVYYDAGRWNAFTSNSGGWYQEQMSLAPFAGHNIELYFTYWTDPAVTGQGWYVDDIEIPEIGFSDNVEGGAGTWTVNAGWQITTGIIPNKFQVNFIQTVTLNICHKVTTLHYISHMYLNKAQEGCMLLLAIDTKLVTFGPSVMVAANQPGYEHMFGTYFEFSADIIHCGH
jgi:hypothetical protein